MFVAPLIGSIFADISDAFSSSGARLARFGTTLACPWGVRVRDKLKWKTLINHVPYVVRVLQRKQVRVVVLLVFGEVVVQSQNDSRVKTIHLGARLWVVLGGCNIIHADSATHCQNEFRYKLRALAG